MHFVLWLRAAVLGTFASVLRAEQLQGQRQGLSAGVESAANPVRKVITLLQKMQATVTEEGAKQEDLYNKFSCFCKKNKGVLSETIVAARGKIESTTAALKAATEKKTQTEADLKEHIASRAEAKDTVAKSTAIRKREAAAYAKVKSDSDANLAALANAISAIERGVMGGFLQTPAARRVQKFAMDSIVLADTTRDELLAYLQGGVGQGYIPQSGEITGILKQLGDEMSQSLGEATTEERSAILNFEALMAAKKKEVASLQKQIEEEMKRSGNLALAMAGMSNDIEDTKSSLSADEQFKLELATSCDTKSQEWEEMKRTRAQELVALAETLKVLSDDDALELFKKTLPIASMSLVQLDASQAAVRRRVLEILAGGVTRRGKLDAQPGLDLISLALWGKKVGFDRVVALIDKMTADLKAEQREDDHKQEYCNVQLDKSDDKRKQLSQSFSDTEATVEEMKGTIAELSEELAALRAGIKTLDASVAEASELRKQESAEFKALMISDTTAKEVLGWAKNRLNQFYNPKLYRPPPERELTEEERITVNMGGVLVPITPGGIAGTGIGAVFAQISAHSQQQKVAPPAAPGIGAYGKKSEQGHGVIEMIDLLIKDLDKEMAEAGVEEKDSQKEYEKTMGDAATKRIADTKLVTQKTAERSATEEGLQIAEEDKAGTARDLMGTQRYVASLHAECDWLLKYHDVRKEARAGEIESLKDAKAVLHGADYSLSQKGSKSM